MKEPTSSQGLRARRREARRAGKLTAEDVARELGAAPRLVRWRIGPGAEIAADADGMVERDELDRIRAKFPCKAEGCPHVALGPSGYCHDHKAMSQLGRERTPDGYLRTPEQREHIAAGMRGKPRPANAEAMRRLWADPEQREALLEAQKRGQDERSRTLKAAGRLTADVAAAVGRSPTTVTEHVRHEWAHPDVATLAVAARPAYIWSEEAEREYRRWLAKHPDGRLQRFAGGQPSLDQRGRRRVTDQATAELAYANWCKSTGRLDEDLSDEAARAIVRPTIKARRSVFRFNAGRRQVSYHEAWAEYYDESVADWRKREQLGLLEEVEPGKLEAIAGPLEICFAIAEMDYAAEPKRWKYAPSEKPDAAARRVWMAIKRHKARR